jgi:hypothetical protein
MLGLALLAQPSFKKLPSGAKHLPFSRWYEFPVLKTALNLKPTAAERRETGLLVRATDDNLLGHFQKLPFSRICSRKLSTFIYQQ